MNNDKLYRSYTEAQKKKIGIAIMFIVFLFVVAVAYFIGKPMIAFVSEPEKFRAWVDSSGFLSRIVFVGMVIIQLIIAVIPGEPLEIGAGYAFGAIEGTLLCLIGIFIGSIIVFQFVRKFGIKLVDVFFSREKILSLRFLQDSKRLNILTFIVFFIPGTPKDLLCYFIGLTEMPLSTWMLITSVARLPSVITSTIAGDALGLKQYQFAIIVFAATLIISGLGIWIYRRIGRQHESKSK